MEAIVEKRLPGNGAPSSNDLGPDERGVGTDFDLRVLIHPQFQEMQQIVQVHFPISFGVGGKWKIFPGLFPGDASIKPFPV